MSREILLKISGVPVYWDGTVIDYMGEFTVCADGSPRAYGPSGCNPEPLDFWVTPEVPKPAGGE